jgi:Peptidase A4 family
VVQDKHISEMDAEDRSLLTEQMIKHITLPAVIPTDFDPMTATNAELVKHGLPVRPDQTTQPVLRAKWDSLMSRPLTFIVPELEASDARLFSTANLPNVTGVKPAGVQPFNSGSPAYSGAFIYPNGADQGEVFGDILGSWVVPEPELPQSAWNEAEQQWQDGAYAIAVWCGLDGFTAFPATVSPNIVAIGTISSFQVSGGQITNPNVQAIFQWGTSTVVSISNFVVEPDDSVSVLLCGTDNHVTAGITNNTKNITAPAITMSSPSPGLVVQGLTAEWVVSLANNDNFAAYSTVTISDANATSRLPTDPLDPTSNNLANATLFNLVQNGVTLSTAAFGPNPEELIMTSSS